MALLVTILKQTETQAVVKVSGLNDSASFSLATDLLSSTMELHPTVPQKVEIQFVQWSVGPSDKITVTRNGVSVLNCYQNGVLDFAGNGGFNETSQDTHDFTVTIAGEGGIFLTLRKAAGYISKIQPWKYGQYDDPTSTTV